MLWSCIPIQSRRILLRFAHRTGADRNFKGPFYNIGRLGCRLKEGNGARWSRLGSVGHILPRRFARFRFASLGYTEMTESSEHQTAPPDLDAADEHALVARGQGADAVHTIWFERPQNQGLELWAYSDKMSYARGDEVVLYVHTTARG
jgi:hypothetical protein